MARQSKTIEQIINDIIDYYNEMIQDAIPSAANLCQNDIEEEAKNCLVMYYSKKPSSYHRNNFLEEAISVSKPINNRIRGTSDMKTVIKVIYNPDVLTKYHSHSKNNPNIDPQKTWEDVEGDYVLTNYLEGKHPFTNGSRIPQEARESYGVIEDKESPYNRMDRFLKEEMPNKFKLYCMKELFRISAQK